MKKTLLFITAASLLLVSCAKEQLVEERSYTGPVTVVSATFESLSNGATKAAVNDAGTFTWQNGDKAAFAESSGSASYCSGTNSTDGTTAQFEIDGSHTFTNSSWAIYPSDLTTDQTPATLKVKVPASRVWTTNQTNVAMYGVKEASTSNFNFNHMGGLVRVMVNNVPTNAREFVFKAREYKINGEFTVETESEYKVIKTASSDTEGEQTYTLTWATSPASENSMVFYIPLPVGTYSKGFAFYLKDQDHNTLYSKVGSTSQPVARKQLLLMPAITLMGGAIEPAEKAAIVANIPAGYSGDFLLPQSEKVLLKIDATGEDHNINLKYNGGNVPTNLKIQVEGDDNFSATLSGNLPYTHVDFTQGHIDHTELITSSSTFAVIKPATVGTLVVKGGNVVLKGATVGGITVDANAVADGETKAPVQIVMEKDGESVPAVTNGITAAANVIVAPKEEGIEVTVKPENNAKVATEEEAKGTVKNETGTEITTKAVAKIGDAQYITLADAIAAVKDNQEIKLIADVEKAAGISVAEGKNFTVNFDGHTYAMECPGAGSEGTKTIGFQLLKGSKIVFTGGEGKVGTIKCTDANKNATWSSDSPQKGIAMMIQNYANLTLDNMKIDASNIALNDKTFRYAISNNSGDVKFTGNTTITTNDGDYAFDVCKYGDYAAPTVTWNSTGSVTGSIELSGGEFVLGHNLAVKQPIKVIAPATLNLGDCTLSAANEFTRETAGVIIVNRKGDLTVKGNANGTIQANQVYAAVLMTEKDVDTKDTTNPAKLTVESGTLIGLHYGIVGNGSTGRGNTVITIKGGIVKGTKENDCAGIYHPQSGTLTVNNGIVEGAVGIYVKAGTVTTAVDGGTIKGIGAKSDYTPCTNGFHPTGDAIVFDNCGYPGGEPNATINGGAFISNNGNAIASYATGSYSPISPVINGGTFSDEGAIKYAAKNAKITVKLEANRTAGTGVFVKADQNQTIIFDLNNWTFSANGPAVGSNGTQTQAFHLEKGNTITIQNGKIECTDANKNKTWASGDTNKGIAMIIQNYADLTLDGVTINATNIAHNGNNARYAVSNNCGTVEFKGNTTINAPVNGDFAFDVCKSGTYAEPKVTWNSTGSVTGKIELTGGEFVVAQNLTLTQPIRTKAAAAKLTVNANITPATGWSAGDALVIVNRTGNLTINGSGTISGNQTVSAAVKMTEKTVDEADAIKDKVAKLTVDGTVTLEGEYYGIVGNGSRHGTEITVNGGTIKGVHANDNLGIYHPQSGTLNITGGTIEGYSSAVEMRAGTLEITGGTFTSTANSYNYTPNGNGNTIKGVAIAISEHSTNKGITAKLNGGSFTGGAYQLGVANLNDRINITKAANLEITVNSGYKWDNNKLVKDAQN